jgi:uncharacterized protein
MIDLLNIPLSDEEIDDLASYLVESPGSMSIETLDGFLTALVCSPELITPSVYFPYIWGDLHEFNGVSEAERYTTLILRYFNSIAKILIEKDTFDPLLIESDGSNSSVGNRWSIGFMTGMKIGGYNWKKLLYDENESGLLVPIMALAHEHDENEELRTKTIDDTKRELLLASIAVYTPRIYKYFEQDRAMSATSTSTILPYKNINRHIGRNDPCICGSHRKFKHCCGKN